ncbi:hypothetical protein BAE44_0025074 [Dichanthelium oligosanthes]|uniref:Uncharacterized protein n=1 Tax=Dichanthelium oligosanthes TaxID=888268 RepID=A0A1E5UM15_9POAL|nr:hypothetical protein BAE44_0025074 [Dichanthelium oligosanthes]
MALLSDDAEFYARAAATWLLSAALDVAILRGWIPGQGFRARTLDLALLYYSTWLARDALELHLVHGIAPESRRCKGPGVAGVLAIGERIMTDKAWLRVLLWVAGVYFFVGLAVGTAVGGAVWGKTTTTMPPSRPTINVPARRGLGGAGGLLVEIILLFVPCVLSCVHSLPIMVPCELRGCCSGIVLDRNMLME